MIYHFSLQSVAIIAGIILVLIGLPGLIRPGPTQDWIKRLPRSYIAGIILLTIDLAWSLWLLATMEMGEFQSFRHPLLIVLPIGYFLVLRFVDEFLAVRALGILCLLGAEPLLDAAFFRNDPERLVVTVFAYVLIVAGIIWVTMPYLLRDQINWGARNSIRWRCLHALSLLYGAAVLVLAAIGDFILTLPALKALRDANRDAHIEILGYAQIAALADNRYYANAVRSIEYGALSRFFARSSELPDHLSEYFAGFDLIISYLFDPDLIFQTNLERAGSRDIIIGPAKLSEDAHAAVQLAKPVIADLGLFLESASATVYPTLEDREFAKTFLKDLAAPIIALHPGSGSEKKNWPISNWMELGNRFLNSSDFSGSFVVITGEADAAQASALQSRWPDSRVRFASRLPLTNLAAVLEEMVFVGHDSGISHLAAAAGAKCVLLFGPTNPEVWAPMGDNVEVLRAEDKLMENIRVDLVHRVVRGVLPGGP
jgi:heptosyltransferase-2